MISWCVPEILAVLLIWFVEDVYVCTQNVDVSQLYSLFGGYLSL